MVGQGRRGLRGLDRAPHDRVGRPTHRALAAAGDAPAAPRAVPGGEALGQPFGVQDLRLDDLRQRHLADQDLLTAVGVEGAALGQLVLVGGGQGQAVAVGEYPSRIVVHVASPGTTVGQFRSPDGLFPLRTVRNHSRYVPEATRREGMPHLASRAAGRADQDFGRNVSVSVRHVFVRCSPSHVSALAVYIRPYPRPSLTTVPRSTDR
ncbi:hypothetical protein STREPTOSP366_41010 [Streptomyces variabilis]